MAYAEKVRSMQLHKVWDCLVAKAVRKGRAEDEVYAVARWLLGYAKEDIDRLAEEGCTYGEFFDKAPALNPKRNLVTGRICGVKVEDIEAPIMHDVRVLDKMVDDLAHGKPLAKVLRAS